MQKSLLKLATFLQHNTTTIQAWSSGNVASKWYKNQAPQWSDDHNFGRRDDDFRRRCLMKSSTSDVSSCSWPVYRWLAPTTMCKSWFGMFAANIRASLAGTVSSSEP